MTRTSAMVRGTGLAAALVALLSIGTPPAAADPTAVPAVPTPAPHADPGPGEALPEPSVLLARASDDALSWPADGRLSSRFGPRWGRLHRGIDIAAPTGAAIRAAGDGRVVFVGTQGGYGLTVEIDHGRGQRTRYAHQSRTVVERGDRVRRGQRIGDVGSTGASTGPHLHFELEITGEARDPLPALPRR